jgi:hypothetical protein
MDPEEFEARMEQWRGAHLDRIHLFCEQQGVEHPRTMNKEQLSERLVNYGLQAYQAFGAPLLPPGNGQVQPRRARLELRKQLPMEDITDFLKHADLFFNLDHTADDEAKVAHLLTKVQRNIGVVIEDMFKAGVDDYQSIRDRLLDQYTIKRFDRLTRFRELKPINGESIIQYGMKLRAEYLLYILVDERQATVMEKAILGALMEQLFLSIDNGIASQVKTRIYEDPTLTWMEILKITDNFCQTTTKLGHPARRQPETRFGYSSTGQYPRQTATSGTYQNSTRAYQGMSRYGYCEFHKAPGHPTAKCRAKKFAEETTENISPTPSLNGDQFSSSSVRCFKCNNMGHIARNCPQQSGNDMPGRLSLESSVLTPKHPADH